MSLAQKRFVRSGPFPPVRGANDSLIERVHPLVDPFGETRDTHPREAGERAVLHEPWWSVVDQQLEMVTHAGLRGGEAERIAARLNELGGNDWARKYGCEHHGFDCPPECPC